MDDGTTYVPTDKRPLAADDVRNAVFSRPRRRRNGFAEREVREFLECVAAALAFRDHQLAALMRENALIKSTLRQLQPERFGEYMARLYTQRDVRDEQR